MALAFFSVNEIAKGQTSEREFFVDVVDRLQKNKAEPLLEKISKRKSVVETRIVRIQAKFLKEEEGEPIKFNVFRGISYQVRMVKIISKKKEKFIWRGKIEKDGGTVTLVVNKGKITGMIRAKKETYSIEHLVDDIHTVFKIDQSKFPPEHPKKFPKGAIRNQGAIRDRSKAVSSNISLLDSLSDSGQTKRIKVLVCYTKSASDQTSDIVSLIELAVDEANQSYINSNINLELELVHTYEVNYTESSSFDTDLDRFSDPDDGHMDEIHDKRYYHCADIAVLIINNADYCGLADTIEADVNEAFAAVHFDCATGYYSFAHEIGHLQGARHNPEADSTNSPYKYGHGYLNVSGGWRTIMAYNDSANCCTRLQYW
jgi:hypothetical protein